MLQQILSISKEINKIESKNVDSSKLTLKKKTLATLHKELELLTKEYGKVINENKQLKDQWLLTSKENERLNARTKELEKLQKSNEELIKKYELLENEKLNKNSWINFMQNIGKDWSQSTYNSLKMLVIGSILQAILNKYFNTGEFNKIKDLLTKYFSKEDSSLDNGDVSSIDSLSYFDENEIKITEEKSTQTVNNEINTDVIDNEEREGIDSPLWTSRSYATTGVNTETTNLEMNPTNIPLPEPVDHDLIEETSDLTSSTETIKPVKEYKDVGNQVNTVDNSNLTTIIDREQSNLGIDSQSDQGYVNVSNDILAPDTKKYIENLNLGKKLLEEGDDIKNKIDALDLLNDHTELFNLYAEMNKVQDEMRIVGNEIQSFVDKHKPVK
jgi:hypothetical protein